MIYELLQTRSDNTPDKVALCAPGRTDLTYQALISQIELVTNALIAKGVQADNPVAVVLPNGPDMAVAILGTTAMAICAPLNPAYSHNEFDFYFTDIKPRALIIESGMNSPAVEIAKRRDIAVIELTPTPGAAAGVFTITGSEHCGASDLRLPGEKDCALVLHTSGTTSRPKMVPLTQENLLASCHNIASTLRLTEADRCLNVMPLFHIHGLVGGLLSSVVAGASIVCTSGFNSEEFLPLIETFRPTWYTAVPTIHHAVLSAAQANRSALRNHSLRFMRSSSSALPIQVMEGLEEIFKVPVIESYGMTEAAHQMASNPLPPGERKASSVGIAAGPEIAIMDETGNLLSSGETGEIVVRGANVMCGYANYSDANLTSFTQGWFRTGDQGHLDKDGYLFITGRIKEIINRGGEKISPREVDDVILQHPAVEQAVTFAVPHATLGEDIAAAIVLRPQSQASVSDLRHFAATKLADFKVPHQIVFVDKIPQGPTAKVVRVGLAQKLGLYIIADSVPSGTDSFEAPLTTTEIALAGIWQSLLRQERIGRCDNFFRLGGDSLIAARIISRIQSDLQAMVSPLDFFDAPTVAELAARIDNGKSTQTASWSVDIDPVPRVNAFQLSFAQRALWFLDQFEPERWVYNRSDARRFTGVIDLHALEQSLNQIICRHEALRTCFPLDSDAPVQVIKSAQPITLNVIDLCRLPHSEVDVQAQKLAKEEACRPFDLTCAPMLRATVVKSSATDHILIVIMHHIASDGWSSTIFWNELAAHYNAITTGTTPNLSRLPIQYVDYAEWQHRHLQGERLEKLQSYWKQQIGTGPLPQLRFFKEPVAPAGPAGHHGARQLLRLPRAVSQALRILTATEEASLFMGLLAALNALLYRYTGQTDIVVGTPMAGRNSAQLEGVIGNFANLLPLRTDIEGNPTFRTLVKRVRGVTLQAYQHDDLPLSMLADFLRAQQPINLGFPFEVMLNLRNFPSQPIELTGLDTAEFECGDGMARSPLNLEVVENAGGLSCMFEFDTDRVDKEMMEQLPTAFQTLLEAMVADPDQPIGNIHLPEIKVLQHFENSQTSSAVDDPTPGGFHHCFKAQVEPTPNATAVCHEGNGLSSVNSHGDTYAFPLSFAQQRLWFLHQLEPKGATYNISTAYRLSGNLDITALQQSLNSLIQRHEVLRTTFSIRDGEPMQIVHPASALSLLITDLRDVEKSQREETVERLLQDHASQPFDLEQGPLFRVGVIQINNDEHVLHISMHHIISDGWSMGVLFKELTAIYSARRAGKPCPLPDLPIQYADYAIWQRNWLAGEELERQLSYWQKQLENLPTLQLPTNRPRPTVQTFRGSSQSVELSAELSQALKGLSQREGVTLFMALLAAFQTLLCRYSGQHDIAVGSPIAGRTRQETEGLIGFFVNTLVLRTDISNNPSFRQLLGRVRQVALDAYDHQEIPFEKLVEELNPDRSLTTSPLFQVMFALQNAGDSSLQLEGLSIAPIRTPSNVAKFDLSLTMTARGDKLRASLNYNTDLFDASTIERMLGHFQVMLEALTVNPDQRIGELPLLTEAEKHQLLVEWNDTQREYPKDTCIHELFEKQVERSPDAVAVVFEDQQLSYRELNRQGNQLAHYLRKLGVGPESLVGICMERSLEMVIGLLAILKAGGAYVPLDPAYPEERLGFMLEDSRVAVLLTQKELLSRFGEIQNRIVGCLDRDWEEIAQQSGENPDIEAKPGNLAYVIYTSGSTGKPKGVMITHHGISNRLLWMQDAYHLKQADRVLQKTPFSFDVSVWEFFWPLISGACLVVAPPGSHQDPNYLVKLVSEQKITTLHFVPSMLQSFLEVQGLESCDSLKLVICSGEALPFQLQERFFARLGIPLNNLYGPTEASVDVTSSTCPPVGNRRVVPIGRPIANTQIYLLDSYLRPVSIGVAGELHIGGAGLARGYLSRPELTAEKFIPDPFSSEPGARIYKSGDLARYLPDGQIEFLGRIDNQVKMRGFRIELGEIESVLSQHPAVRETVVIAFEAPECESENEESRIANPISDKQCVAYVVSNREGAPTVGDLRSFLKQKLPDYMVPSEFILLEAMPSTPNGKMDRRRLPAPSFHRPGSSEVFVAPRTLTEEIVAGIWAEVLGVQQVGIHENFFDLGGHSLKATQVMSRLYKAFRVDVPLRELFETPTVGELAIRITEKQAQGVAEAELVIF